MYEAMGNGFVWPALTEALGRSSLSRMCVHIHICVYYIYIYIYMSIIDFRTKYALIKLTYVLLLKTYT